MVLILDGAYSISILGEYMESGEEKEWLYTHYETVKQSPITSGQQIELATEMLKSQATLALINNPIRVAYY